MSKVGKTRRAPDPLACRDGGAGDGQETARVAGALEEILGFPLAMVEEFDKDLVLDVFLDGLVLVSLVLASLVPDFLVVDVLVCLVLEAAWNTFFRRCRRPQCP